ncbi:MAG TPA: hypothetical protein VK648_03595 [Gemmatimonadaceae bacterium]|nr:hypothetical protein [Gemmatimonadaceae bacterium]
MEVFTTFFVILLAGMALPIVLLISGVLFDLFFVIFVVVETMVSRKRSLGRLEPSPDTEYGRLVGRVSGGSGIGRVMVAMPRVSNARS